MGLYDPDVDIYDVPDELLYYRRNNETKKDKLHFNKIPLVEREMADMSGGIGSNCWAVHGNHTKSGMPLMACDPHLMKWLQSKWYLISIRWGKDNFVTGGSTPGFPLFTYARTKYQSWGATAINPDISDLYVEQVRGDEYLYDGQWHKFKKVKEAFNVRF